MSSTSSSSSSSSTADPSVKASNKEYARKLSSKPTTAPMSTFPPSLTAETDLPREEDDVVSASADDAAESPSSLSRKLTWKDWMNKASLTVSKSMKIRKSRSETDFRNIAEDTPVSPVLQPPPLIPRGFIRSVSLGGEDKQASLAHIAAKLGEETDLDALPPSTAQSTTLVKASGQVGRDDSKQKEKRVKIKKKEKKSGEGAIRPADSAVNSEPFPGTGGLEKFPGEDIVIVLPIEGISARLEHRPPIEDLQNKNILHEEHLQADRDAVARRLSFRLEQRPTATELQEKNILKMGLEVEAASQAEQVKQDFEERKSAMKSILKKRARFSWLENPTILRGGEKDESFAETIQTIKSAHGESARLASSSEMSPKAGSDVDAKGKKLNFVESVEVIPTFRNSEYSRRPDSSATFLNLNNKAKKQIREELNEFKRDEMAVHELSQNNTVFH